MKKVFVRMCRDLANKGNSATGKKFIEELDNQEIETLKSVGIQFLIHEKCTPKIDLQKIDELKARIESFLTILPEGFQPEEAKSISQKIIKGFNISLKGKDPRVHEAFQTWIKSNNLQDEAALQTFRNNVILPLRKEVSQNSCYTPKGLAAEDLNYIVSELIDYLDLKQEILSQ